MFEYLMPVWFANYNLLIHSVFFVITFLVYLLAFKVYKLTQYRQSRLFATAFFFISLAFLLETILNALMVFKISQNISLVSKIMSINLINLAIINVHLILCTIGLVTLAYMTLKVKSAKTYILILILSLLFLFLVPNVIYFYYILTFTLLIFICLHYFNNYLNKKKINSLLVLIAFLLLAAVNIPILFLGLNREAFYVVDHVVELLAYVLILVNLILVRRHEQKTRPASNRS